MGCKCGAIQIGGVDVRHISLSELYDQISYVSQDNFLFNMSLRDNKGVYIEAPDKSSGKRRQNIRISYDLVGFIPLNELMKEETA